MPGKQMAIDADLSAGLIDETEARAAPKTAGRRKRDSSARWMAPPNSCAATRSPACSIVFINVIGGMIIGIAQQGHVVRGRRADLHAADRRRRPGHAGAGADRLHRRRPAGVEGRRERSRRQGAARAAFGLSQGARHVGRGDAGHGAAAGHADDSVHGAGGGASALAFIIDEAQATDAPTSTQENRSRRRDDAAGRADLIARSR